MSSPYRVCPAATILNPLNSGGLCEPVTWMPPSTSQLVKRQIERRGRQHAHVHRRATGLRDAVSHRPRQELTRRAIVAPHGEPRIAPDPGARDRRDGPPYGVCQLGRQLIADDASDVVLPKDEGGYFHAISIR